MKWLESSEFLVITATSVAGVVLLSLIFVVVARFYRRCAADEALVRTGAGGNKVVIGGGIVVYPILHQLLRVSLRSVKLSVERGGKNALVTADKIKANVTTELYIKVEPTHEAVLAAARSFGERNLDEHAIGDLIEGKLTDALRSVAANKTFMGLHTERKEFAESIQEVLAVELKKNGLLLENVSITALAMVPVKELDANDVFDADGLRAITLSVQTNRELTNRIQREKDNSVQEQDVRAKKRSLELDQEQKMAEADQQRKVQEYAAKQGAETAKAVFVQEQSRELARIDQQQAIAVANAQRQQMEKSALIAAERIQQAAEIEKQREIERATIEKQKVVQAAEIDRQTVLESSVIQKERAIQVADIGKQIAVTESQEQMARAEAAKAIAVAEQERARQTITTVEVTAQAEREKAIAVIQAEAEAAVKRALADGEMRKNESLAQASLIKAQGEAAVKRTEAEAKAQNAEKESEAMSLIAEAIARKGIAEADARKRMIEAENAVSSRNVLRDVMLEALRVAPDVTRELMAPVSRISEIKVLQTNGFGGSNNAPAGPLGLASPILKTVLEAGAAYPMLRELMNFAKSEKLDDKARALLGELGPEIEALLPKPAEEKQSQPPTSAE